MIGPTNANARYIKAISSSTNDHVVTFNGTGGNSVKDSGKTIGVSIPTPNTSTDVGMSLVVQSDGSLSYGVPPGNYVTLDTAQTITGLKTINNANTQDAFHIVNTRLIFQNQNIPDITTAPTADRDPSYIAFAQAGPNVNILGSLGYLQRANGDGETYLTARRYTNNNTETFTLISHAADSGGHMTGPYRTSDITDNDVLTAGNGVTLGTNQTISGVKTFTNNIKLGAGYHILCTTDDSLLRIQGGVGEGHGGRLVLSGMSRTNYQGYAELVGNDGVNTYTLCVTPTGVRDLKVNGNINGYDTVYIQSNASNYREGIRINRATTGWATFILGSTQNSTSGVAEGWTMHRDPDGKFLLSGKDSTYSTALFYGTYDSSTSRHTLYVPHDFRVGGQQIMQFYNDSVNTGGISTWGTLTSANGYTHVAGIGHQGGDIAIASTTTNGGIISVQVDGWFYQDEGRYRCLDRSDLTVSSGSPSGGKDGDVWIQY